MQGEYVGSGPGIGLTQKNSVRALESYFFVLLIFDSGPSSSSKIRAAVHASVNIPRDFALSGSAT